MKLFPSHNFIKCCEKSFTLFLNVGEENSGKGLKWMRFSNILQTQRLKCKFCKICWSYKCEQRSLSCWVTHKWDCENDLQIECPTV